MKHDETTPIPELLIGAPGIGKTAGALARAAKEGLHPIAIHLAEMDPLEISGAMVPVHEERIVERYPPRWWITASKEPCLILLDELTTAAREQRVAALRCADPSRTMGGIVLHRKTLIIGTANPAAYAAGSREPLTAPEISRFRIRPMDASGAILWLANHGDPRVRTVGAFLRAAPQHAIASAGAIEKAVEAQRPFPTPRSWHMAAVSGLPEKEWGSLIGDEGPLAFMAFNKNQDLPDPLDIIAGKKIEAPKTGDAALATACGIVSVLGALPTEGQFHAALKWFDLAAEAGYAGHVTDVLRDVCAKHQTMMLALKKREGKSLLSHYMEMLRAQGIGQ